MTDTPPADTPPTTPQPIKALTRTFQTHPKRWIAVGMAAVLTAVGGTGIGLAISGASTDKPAAITQGAGLNMAPGESDAVTCGGPQLSILPASATGLSLQCADIPTTTLPSTTTTVAGSTTTAPATTTTAPATTTTIPSTTTTVVSGGFPNASNTGVPAGTVLTNWTGGTISTCQTITGKNFPNGVTVTATNGTTSPNTPCVTINNSHVNGVLFVGYGGTGPTVINHTTVVGSTATTAAPVWQFNFYGNYLNVSGGRGQVDCDGPCSLSNSYVHGLAYEGAAHLQAFESNGTGGGPELLEHNTFECRPTGSPTSGGGCAADVSFFGDNSQVANVTIDNNYFVSSTGQFGFALYSGGIESSKAFPVGKNIVVSNNTFEAGQSGKCGDTGVVPDWQVGNGNSWVGNHFDTGVAIPTP